ncbi:rhomboid family intramembrane serine protease [Hymenobacter sp.]|uniref:rhomboid family intramembrane serine protease n=1 Tax=Hymenobacter sp. TaxID=1898978 RepID=UPI00286CB010|nr:rhomboid family intramembrane serine protease [Hymenobacter sp.]
MFNLTPTVRTLLLANIIFYLAQISLLPLITQVGSLYPIGSPYFFPWQFLTYMFLHGSFFHILFNMFGLISFGPLLEQRWGGQRFLVFWLICGVGAGVLYEGVRFYEGNKMEQARQEFRRAPSGGDFAEFFRAYYPEATGYETLAGALTRNPDNTEYRKAATDAVDAVVTESRDSRNAGMLGASGALFGVLFAFAYLFPNTKLFIFPLPVPIAAKYLVFGYALFELYQGVHRTPGDNVAHFAHLGGLLIGFIVLKFWESGRERFY